jgi:DNA-binding transcriptional LysR family regulator
VHQPFVLFESGSNTRRVVDEFFVKERIEPRIVMETENVEILKAMVKTGLGITIIPYQAVAADIRSRRLFSKRITGHALIRETGWIYPKMSRLPRTVSEVLAVFERVKGKFQRHP